MLKRLRAYPIADTAIASVNNNAMCFGFKSMFTSFLWLLLPVVILKIVFK